jgi:hypothetical protein
MSNGARQDACGRTRRRPGYNFFIRLQVSLEIWSGRVYKERWFIVLKSKGIADAGE